jgi:hypothetical protein
MAASTKADATAELVAVDAKGGFDYAVFAESTRLK